MVGKGGSRRGLQGKIRGREGESRRGLQGKTRVWEEEGATGKGQGEGVEGGYRDKLSGGKGVGGTTGKD